MLIIICESKSSPNIIGDKNFGHNLFEDYLFIFFLWRFDRLKQLETSFPDECVPYPRIIMESTRARWARHRHDRNGFNRSWNRCSSFAYIESNTLSSHLLSRASNIDSRYSNLRYPRDRVGHEFSLKALTGDSFLRNFIYTACVTIYKQQRRK